jgi:hypothetical protein
MADGPKAGTQDKLILAIGGTVKLGKTEVVIEPLDLTEIDEGNFTLDLPEDEDREIGSLREFYGAVNQIIEGDDLPHLPDDVPEGLKAALDAPVMLRRFFLDVKAFKFKKLEIDVSMETQWTLPKIELAIANPRLVVKFEK